MIAVATRQSLRNSPPKGEGAGKYDAHLAQALKLLTAWVADEAHRQRAEAWLRDMRATNPLWLIKEPTSKLATLARLRTQAN